MTSDGRTLPANIDRMTRLLDGSGIGAMVSPAVRTHARQRALELLGSGGDREAVAAVALLAFTAEIFCEIAVDLAARPRDARRLVDGVVEIAGLPSAALGREVLRAPSLPQLSTDIAIEVQLALLLVFADVSAISLWTLSPDGELVLISHVGDLNLDGRSSGQLASALLADQEAVPARGSEVGIRIERWLHPAIALVAHGEAARADHRVLLLEAAAPVLGSILELRSHREPADESVVSSVERRLARLRFDLHDGPQQDTHLLAQDLRSFRDQLRPIIADDPNADRLLGRVDDFEAQLVALDGDLRRIATSVESPFVHPGTLPERLRQITDAFAGRSGFNPQTRLEGDLTKLSESQQIALLSLIREALSNVREHSRAGKVKIAISSHASGVEAKVTDDGQGFDPETTLVKAAREGHLGLVGMHERVRMLGGRTRIDSRPGGPTVISVSLPSWPAQPGLRYG
jgi:signal transduction histidine kinase